MSIVRNSAWNIVGVVIPTIFAIPSLAIYSRFLGVELLGILTLTFALVGYASSFDFGLSRALIRQVSINIDDTSAVKKYMGTTATFVAAVSIILALITWAGSARLTKYLSVSDAHWRDAVLSFHWLSLSIPPYLLSLVGTAYFEGKEDFRILNIVRCGASALNAVVGVASVYWLQTLSSVVAALCVSRWVLCVAVLSLYRVFVNRSDDLNRPALLVFDRAALRSSLTYGGWLTVSNIIGPVMSQFDRFVLSHVDGASVVAFYTVPAEIISRMMLLPGAVSRALFPRLSKRHMTAGVDRRTATLLTLCGSALALVPVFVFARVLLQLWMGPQYGGVPVTVLRILLIGFFFNALALGPFTDLQARGHSRKTAYIHAAELFPYLGLLILLTYAYGIIGTSLAWTSRIVVDYVLMEFFSRRFAGIHL